jgi:preprotein translocase SecE subunit
LKLLALRRPGQSTRAPKSGGDRNRFMIVRWILLGLAAIVVLIALANYKRAIALWERTQELYREVVMEMKKVAWPTRDHVINSTITVGVATLAMVFMFGIIDRLFGSLVEILFTAQ